MINELRLRNLRSFSNETNSEYVKIKPITVLVGKNSSGKSSFLRSFPLLRQSVEAKTTGPVLWYGSYVDFGAYSEAKSNDTNDDQIYFDFNLTVPVSKKINNFFNHFYVSSNSTENLNINIEIGVSENKNKTIAKSLKISVHEIKFEISFDTSEKCSLKVNGVEEITLDNLSYRIGVEFLPHIGEMIKSEKTMNGQNIVIRRFNHEFIKEHFTKKYKSEIRSYFHKNTSDETIFDTIERIGIITKNELPSILKSYYRGNSTFEKNLHLYKDEIVDKFYKLSISRSLSEIISHISTELENTFKNVRYIAPLRATAERYYRHQDLQVEEIDHTGSNLAMFLKSFSESEKRSFTNWTRDYFGFSVRVDELGLHYALKIKTENDPIEYNINDMGFGFSQILPIVASIWIETNRQRQKSKQLIFAIEQPELHLHPEYQARLAKLFSLVIKDAIQKRIDIRIIFETHSKTMINTLGDCVEEGIISEDMINIVLFEKEHSNSSTKVRFSKFDEDGSLVDWPIGFFSGRTE